MPSSRPKALPRVIPCLLLKGHGLTKTVQFREQIYIGDAINAVKIFNEKEVDELMLLDIEATKYGYEPRLDFIREIATEAFMPFAYGGGITNLAQAEALFNLGADKICFNSVAYTNPQIIAEAAKIYGNQSVLVSVDVRKPLFGGYKLYSSAGTVAQKVSLVDHLKYMQDLGAGEIILNSIDNDGVMKGFDKSLITQASSALSVPLVAIGGAGKPEDLVDAIDAGASAVAAGSMFVFHGRHKAVLITYPSRTLLKVLFDA